MKNEKITINGVAKEAGVSIATVSRVINNKGYISEETRVRVENVINDTGFIPNSIARSMILQKTSVIGIIVPDIGNPYLASLVSELENLLTKADYSIMFCNSHFKYKKEKKFIEDLIKINAQGIIIVAKGYMKEDLFNIIRDNLQCISIETNFEGIDCVNITNRQAAFDMTEYLISLGHKRIALIGFNNESKTTMQRVDGYIDAIKKHGLDVIEEYMLDDECEDNVGYLRTKQLLELKDPPTAIFAINDFFALNAYIAIQDKGLEVGKDISVCGFDNINLGELVSPTLTTVETPYRIMAELTTDLLLKKINNGKSDEEGKEILLPTKLVKRKSTQKCSI